MFPEAGGIESPALPREPRENALDSVISRRDHAA
jgi:hypothetical protein